MLKKFVLLTIIILSINKLLLAGWSMSGSYILEKKNTPNSLLNYSASYIIVFASFNNQNIRFKTNCIKGDTIFNYQLLKDSVGIHFFRLVFVKNNDIESVWQLNKELEITDKAFIKENNFLWIQAFTQRKLDFEFNLNLNKKYGGVIPSLAELLRRKEIYSSSDRTYNSTQKIWILSIGINEYKGGLRQRNCVTDAQSYSDYFKKEGLKITGDSNAINIFTLVDEEATKDSIIACLKKIISGSTLNDYFIFNFSGISTPYDLKLGLDKTYFVPYGTKAVDFNTLFSKKNIDSTTSELISLNYLQELFQLIPANNQLFISEAGPSENFKTEFIKALVQNVETSALINKNRIVMVPTKFGIDGFECNELKIQKGPINHFITSLSKNKFNIYDLFDENANADKIVYQLKKSFFDCKFGAEEYFEIFFQRKYLKELQEITGNNEEKTRSSRVLQIHDNSLKKYATKKYALVVGTNTYQKGWDNLKNPIRDVEAVADELEFNYGFEVKRINEATTDSVYFALTKLYNDLDSSDQLLIYFAGHGDLERNLLDDGFLVCTDSKPTTIDPYRNTYISFSKLKKMINKIASKQILVLMDICFGGAFDDNLLGDITRDFKGPDGLNLQLSKRLSEWSKFSTRIVLSSVGDKPALDGAGIHSPFANFLLQTLQTRGENTGGYITSSDIFSLIDQQSRSSSGEGSKVQPFKGGFGRNSGQGEFVFIPTQRNILNR